jgi:predicted MFS family arabinose efflux permease
MPPILNIIAITTFAAALSARSMEPVLPLVADDFGVTVAVAASLSAAMALTYALVQPVLGAAADMFGKPRLMVVCLVLLGITNIIGALATSFDLLFVSRILCGIASGGTFPIAIGLVGDLVAPERRQVALGRILAGGMAGNLLGSSSAGVIGDLLGWRGVPAALGVLMIVAAVAVIVGFRRAGVADARGEVNIAALRRGYRVIMSNPLTAVCYTSVFVEGLCILGFLPFVAALLFDLGETRSSIPGLVIGMFAIGGFFYTVSISRLLPLIGVKRLMIAGAAMMAIQFIVISFGPWWGVQAGCFLLMGWGFYSLHGSLQVFSSELAPEARASAVSLHAFFFFLGQAAGPVVYGFGLTHFGTQPTLFASAAIILALGIVSATLLNRKPAGA